MESEAHQHEGTAIVSSDSRKNPSRLKPAFTFIILIGTLVALTVTVVLANRTSDPKVITHKDSNLGLSIDYPEDWTVSTLVPGSRQLGSDQVLTISNGREQVLVGVDLETTWCQSVDEYDVNVIEVSSKKGEDHRCYRDSKLVTIVRHFESARNGHSYTVISEPRQDVESSIRIVESLRFLP